MLCAGGSALEAMLTTTQEQVSALAESLNTKVGGCTVGCVLVKAVEGGALEAMLTAQDVSALVK